jgi:hypothetical protein
MFHDLHQSRERIIDGSLGVYANIEVMNDTLYLNTNLLSKLTFD